MLIILLFLILLTVGFVLFTTSAARAQLLREALAAIRHVKDTANRRSEALMPFHDALRARIPWAVVTSTLVALNATIFVFMLFSNGALRDPETLVGWGGNFGPRTTNGEWWRLGTSMFVHSGMFHLLVNAAALVQIGRILERLVGHLAFAAVYVAAGLFAGLANLSAYPVAISAGAAGAISGLYGLLLASLIWSMRHGSSVTIPRMALKKLGLVAAVFIVFNAAHDDGAVAAELAGLVAGFVCGLVLARGIGDYTPPARRVAIATAAAGVTAVALAVPLRGITDVRPEIERLVAVEGRTAGTYETAADRFRNGRMTSDALAQVIDRTIVPELQAADAHLKALVGVPHEQQPLVADAEEYLRLRLESWRLRSEGLGKTGMLAHRVTAETERTSDDSVRLRTEAQHKANMLTLGKAEGTERASLEALQRIRPASPR